MLIPVGAAGPGHQMPLTVNLRLTHPETFKYAVIKEENPCVVFPSCWYCSYIPVQIPKGVDWLCRPAHGPSTGLTQTPLVACQGDLWRTDSCLFPCTNLHFHPPAVGVTQRLLPLTRLHPPSPAHPHRCILSLHQSLGHKVHSSQGSHLCSVL